MKMLSENYQPLKPIDAIEQVNAMLLKMGIDAVFDYYALRPQGGEPLAKDMSSNL